MARPECNPKLENTHEWSKPDYINPVKCLWCSRKITLIMVLSKLDRDEITLESFTSKKDYEVKIKQATYWELERMVEQAEIKKALVEIGYGTEEQLWERCVEWANKEIK